MLLKKEPFCRTRRGGGRLTKQRLYFLGYFLLFPIIFMISSILWRFIIQNNDLGIVFTDALGILAIYYFIVSIFFGFRVR